MPRIEHSLDPDEKRPITFDFSDELDDGETLINPVTSSVSVPFGTDPSPDSVVDGSPVFDPTSKMVALPVKGKVDMCDYAIKVVCQTSNPMKKLALVAVLPIRKAT